MKTQTFDLQMPEGKCDSFIAYPDDGKYPGVLLYMDAFGPRAYLYKMAEKLASNGYFVLVPNLLYRAKRAPLLDDVKYPLKAEQMPALFPKLMPLVQSLTTESARSDANIFLDFLKQHKNVSSKKFGITGYCMGGRWGLSVASWFPDLIGAIASYHAGRLVTEEADSPHKLFHQIKAEVYLGHADNDQSMPLEQIKKLNEVLDKAGVKYKAEIYTGAHHGFTQEDLPAYNEKALQKHWMTLLDLLKRTLR